MANKAHKKFLITGRVNDLKSRREIAGLRVEAWDKDLIFNDLVGPWDTAITTAFKSKSTVKATTQKICEKALYAFSGKNNSPDDLVTNLSGQINKAGEDFHKKAAGARPTTKPEKPDSDCNVVKARTGY